MAATMHDPGNVVSSCLWDVSVSALLLLQQELRSPHKLPNLNLSHSMCVCVCVCVRVCVCVLATSTAWNGRRGCVLE